MPVLGARIPPVFQINPNCELAQQYGLRELDGEIRACEDGIKAVFEEEYVFGGFLGPLCKLEGGLQIVTMVGYAHRYEPEFAIKNMVLDRHTTYGYCLRCPLNQHNAVKRLHKCKVSAGDALSFGEVLLDRNRKNVMFVCQTLCVGFRF